MRKLCMDLFRGINLALTRTNCKMLLNHTGLHKLFRKWAKEELEFKNHSLSEHNINNLAIEYMEQLWTAMNQFMEHEIFINDSFNREATEKIRTLAKLPKYYELTPTINHEDLFLVRSFHVAPDEPGKGESTCPVKTLAIFSHNQDFSYGELPEVLKVVNSCLT